MPYRARVSDPETSHAAQDTITGVSELQADILHLIQLYGPMTDEAILAAHDRHGMVSRTPERVRTARGELVAAGKLEWTGDHGVTARGNKARVWGPPTPPTLF
jgi:hypothetical protein